MKQCKDTNHYDNYGSVDDENYACPDYLMKSNNKLNQDSSDNCYSEPEKAIYEELQDNNARDSMYQPLMRDSRVMQVIYDDTNNDGDNDDDDDNDYDDDDDNDYDDDDDGDDDDDN